jgi:hypothetical protein
MQGPTIPHLALPNSKLWRDTLAIALAVFGLLFMLSALAVLPEGHGWAYDLRAYYDAAVRLVETGTPYLAATVSGPFRPGPGGLYLYSPLPALLLVPLNSIPLPGVAWLWAYGHVALLAGACLLLPVSSRLKLVAFGVSCLSWAVVADVKLGNVSLLLTALTIVAWRLLDRPGGGVAIALSMTMRPTMGIFLAWWAVRRHWRAIAWVVGGLLAIVLLSLPFLGLRPYVDYLTVLRNITQVTGVPRNLDLASTLHILGAPTAIAGWALYLGYAVALGACLLSLRRDRELSFVVVAMAPLFLSPLLWDHYFTQLIVPAVFLANRGHGWALLLPLLGWFQIAGLSFAPPMIGLIGMLAPFLAPDRGEPALAGRVEADDVAALDAAGLQRTGA